MYLDASGGIVDALSEEVLAEASLLALEAVAEGLESPVGLALHGGRLLGVVEQAVHGFLEHTLLVAENHLGGLDLEEPLEAVVAYDHAAVEVVEVGGGETAAVEGDEGTEIRRDDRNHLHDHPLGAVDTLGLLEPLDDLEALQQLSLALLGAFFLHLHAEFLSEGFHIELLEEVVDTFGSHLCDELVGIGVGKVLVALQGLAAQDVEIFFLGDEVHLLDPGLALSFGGLILADVDDDVLLVVDHGFQLLGGEAEKGGNLVGG